jgi:hypothetical protein
METTANLLITQDPVKAQELLIGSEVKETDSGNVYLILNTPENVTSEN